MMQRMEDRKQKLDVEIEAHSRSQSERIEQKRTEKEEEVEIEQEEFTFQDMLAALPNALAMNLVVHDSLVCQHKIHDLTILGIRTMFFILTRRYTRKECTAHAKTSDCANSSPYFPQKKGNRRRRRGQRDRTRRRWG